MSLLHEVCYPLCLEAPEATHNAPPRLSDGVFEYEAPRFHHAGRRRSDVASGWSGAAVHPSRRVRLFGHSIQHSGPLCEAFKLGLEAVGFIEGQNVTVEYHLPGGHDEGLPAFMAELVRWRVAVIVGDTSPAIAAKRLLLRFQLSS